MKKLREDINKLKGETKKNETKNIKKIDNSKKYFIYVFEIKDELSTEGNFLNNEDIKNIKFDKIFEKKLKIFKQYDFL